MMSIAEPDNVCGEVHRCGLDAVGRRIVSIDPIGGMAVER
ncbi:hypothetical protein JIR001_22050 [Polycladomyces abyssicola]|uniref:Uncharacterized protein n=1 Tax=Polycladomyces abyssicola TaxID=1125966 RepID=A0A8D5UFJ3_9BACL|nr:hypothetical protein JIR001_22050 [Polycladomyces abyssicola]